MATVNINIEVLNSKPPISDESNTKKTEGQQLNQFQLSVLPLFSVDLEALEPSPKRGNHMLSTCLFPYWIVGQSVGREQPCTMPYPLKFHLRHEATADYLRYAAPR